MKIIGANITGSFILNNQDVTNTLQSSSVWSGSVAAEINSLNNATASLNSATASLSSATASLNAATASIYSATASLNTFTASAATTGSNTFNGNQIVSGSLTVTGSITTPGTLTAQTLVVQTVTSSTVYSSGSNIFGNNISNTQVLTGSVYITGSLNTVGNNYLGGDVYATGGYGLYLTGDNFKELEITSNDDSTYFLMNAYKTSPTASDRATSEKYLDGYVTYDKVYFSGNNTFGITAWPNKSDVASYNRGNVELWIPTLNTTGSFSIRNYGNLSTNFLANFLSNGRTLLNNATDNGVNTLQVSGSIFATSLTGSLLGTATNATSASYAASSTSASYAANSTSASYAINAASASSADAFSIRGNTTIGNDSSSLLVVNSLINSNFFPAGDGTYNLGNNYGQQWNNVYANTYYGSLAGNANSATSASYTISASYALNATNASSATNATTAATASSADNLTVRNTLTAQTLVVQTITSSVDFVTGSTRFGSLLTNTHVFSGSITMNPGGLFVSGSGFVGLNKTSPQRQYTQVANTNGIVFTIQNASSSNEGFIIGFDTTGSTYTQLSDSTNASKIYLNSSGSSYFIGGNVGIGTSTPASANRLEVLGTSGSSGVINPFSVTGYTATTNVGSQATSYGGMSVSNGIDSTLLIRTLGSGHAQIATDASGRYISFATGLFTERVRITSGGYLQLNGASNNAAITTDSSANVIGLYTTSSVIDGIARIEVTGGTYPSTPNTAFVRADTVRFTLNAASTETMRITSGGYLGIRSASPRATLHVQQLTNDGTPSLGTARDGAVFTSNNGNYGLNITIDPSGDTLMQAMRFDGSATAYALKLQPAGGAIVTPNQPLAMGAMPGDQYVPATTFTTISFQTNYGFNQSNIGSCWNNSSNYFTAPQTGAYLINASLYTTNVGQIAAFINGSRTISMVSGIAITGGTTWHGTMMIKMNAGDVLTLRGYGDGGGYIYLNTYHTWFGIYFLG